MNFTLTFETGDFGLIGLAVCYRSFCVAKGLTLTVMIGHGSELDPQCVSKHRPYDL